MAPGPSIAPAPTPGPGSGKHHFDGHSQVKDFIQTLLLYGGYNELADILVNLTSLATEMDRLVSEGYVLTVLAPNDEAMTRARSRASDPPSPQGAGTGSRPLLPWEAGAAPPCQRCASRSPPRRGALRPRTRARQPAPM
ncbi:unnamed protein product [Miscanthus lutarioriparius]|uniref:Uncharacterized protein n=1 Tax=Miscanthus lutarioriparius TaxID=422564 RepID=A0A811QH53_9POAL|nr:unnamed protein product [Miscanthus lutarioriparius]